MSDNVTAIEGFAICFLGQRRFHPYGSCGAAFVDHGTELPLSVDGNCATGTLGQGNRHGVPKKVTPCKGRSPNLPAPQRHHRGHARVWLGRATTP